MSKWQVSRFEIDLGSPKVMGILNVTPDSFSDGGRHSNLREAMKYAEQLLRDGADILDIGGESTRPGSPVVPVDEEIARVLPVVRAAMQLRVPVSVDTYKPAVMHAVLDVGADIINDVWALRQPGAHEIVCAHPLCGVCLMHMHRDPQTMHIDHMPADAVIRVKSFLAERVKDLTDRGVHSSRIVLDTGIGFGKSVSQNFSLLARQAEILELGFPLLAGWSRKGSLGEVSGRVVGERMVPSVTAAVLAVERGARIVRVHDVADTVAALRVWKAMHAQDACDNTAT